MNTSARYQAILQWFRENHPEAVSELNYRNPFELLVAVVLSAQCTDKRVNLTTPALFAAYPDAAHLAAASVEEIYQYIQSISYPNSKAAHLQGLARKLLQDFGGEVPSDLEALQTLPGVGRKTANVVLAVAFHQPAMPVDTHVFRVARRLGLVEEQDRTPQAVELRLVQYIPVGEMALAHHWLLLHGRYTCTSRIPRCKRCGLKNYCRSWENGKR